jgi:hypothetical protein
MNVQQSGRRAVLTAALAMGLALCPAAAARSEAQSGITIKAGSAPDRVTLTLAHADLCDAVDALATQFKFTVANLDKFAGVSADGTFDDQPVESVITAILKRAEIDFVLLRSDETGVPSRLILAKAVRTTGGSTAATAAEASSASRASAASRVLPAISEPEPMRPPDDDEARVAALPDTTLPARDQTSEKRAGQSLPLPQQYSAPLYVAPPVSSSDSLGTRPITAEEMRTMTSGTSGSHALHPPIPQNMPPVTERVATPDSGTTTSTTTAATTAATTGATSPTTAASATSTIGGAASSSVPGVTVQSSSTSTSTTSAAGMTTQVAADANSIQKPTGPVPMTGLPPGTPTQSTSPTPPIK